MIRIGYAIRISKKSLLRLAGQSGTVNITLRTNIGENL